MRNAAALVTLVVAVVAVPQAENGSAAGLYNAALSRERALRAPSDQSPTLNDLRAAIAAYEAIPRRFPTSDYGDHALWQAAGLALEAFDRYHQQHDFNTGNRLLDGLVLDYPESSLVLRAVERRRRFDALTRIVWLTDIDREVRDDVVRVTVTLDGEVTFHSERLERPARLFFDLRGTETAPPFRNATLTFDGDVVRQIRLGRHPNHVTRVVLDTEGAKRCNIFTLYEPFRLVADCQPSSNRVEAAAPVPASPASPAPRSVPPTVDPNAETTAAPTPVSRPADRPAGPAALATTSFDASGSLSLARQLGLGISRIVIDAGHGGHDPGTRARGLEEADLVLDIARRLEQRLSHYPIEVVLTRRRDDYMPLEARTRLANRVDADLFLSIHANASRRAGARGVETYFLNFTTDTAAEALAARENAAAAGTIGHLPNLLQTIATNDKLEESRQFAELVQHAMIDKLRKVDPEIPDLGVKQAPFVVLIGAHMPSVLAEISFVTNQHDATLLSTDTYRDLIADALLDAILRYQRALKSGPQLETVTQAGGD